MSWANIGSKRRQQSALSSSRTAIVGWFLYHEPPLPYSVLLILSYFLSSRTKAQRFPMIKTPIIMYRQSLLRKALRLIFVKTAEACSAICRVRRALALAPSICSRCRVIWSMVAFPICSDSTVSLIDDETHPKEQENIWENMATSSSGFWKDRQAIRLTRETPATDHQSFRSMIPYSAWWKNIIRLAKGLS